MKLSQLIDNHALSKSFGGVFFMWSDDAAHGRGGDGSSTAYVYSYAAPNSPAEWARCAADLIDFAKAKGWSAEEAARHFVSAMSLDQKAIKQIDRTGRGEYLLAFIDALNKQPLQKHAQTIVEQIRQEDAEAQQAANKKLSAMTALGSLRAVIDEHLDPEMGIDDLPKGIKLAARILNLTDLQELTTRDAGRDNSLKDGLDALEAVAKTATEGGIAPKNVLNHIQHAVKSGQFYISNSTHIDKAMQATGRTPG